MSYRKPIFATAAVLAATAAAILPSAASAAQIGPCAVGANTPTLAPDPYYQTVTGPLIRYTAGIKCSTSGSLGGTAYLERWVGYWKVVAATTNSGYGTFVGFSDTHVGADGGTYRTQLDAQTSWGSVWATSGNYTAP